MAPVISSGINGTGGANTKHSQSPKMHSKAVGVTLSTSRFSSVRHLDILVDVRDVGTAFEWDVHCVQARGILTLRSLIKILCAEFSR
jgi:hypothetical protein